MSDFELYTCDNVAWRAQHRELEKNTEPLLSTKGQRDSLYPIKYPGMWDYFEKHMASIWFAHEIDLSKDTNDWNSLNRDEQFYIKHGLAFFAGSDFIINENQKKDNEEVTILEYKFFNDDKIARENIHSITYANLLEHYVTDPVEKVNLQNAVTEIPSVKKKADWMREYIDNGTYVERLVAGAIMEGIFFSGTFCAIFWLRKRNLMPALCDANEFISRDEGLHRDFACYVYRDLVVNKLHPEILMTMVKRAVEIECEFVCDSLPVTLIGMNSGLMSQYIQYVADHLMMALVGQKIYNVEDPFSDWMSAISLKVKADFFVHRATSYANSAILSAPEDVAVRFNDDSF